MHQGSDYSEIRGRIREGNQTQGLTEHPILFAVLGWNEDASKELCELLKRVEENQERMEALKPMSVKFSEIM